MKAVVMAGGEGTRLRPLTLNIPKPLVPVCNKPIMEHIVESLREQGITENIATLYYLADEIQSYFGDGSSLGVSIEYSIEESPLGTAGAVKILEDKLDDTFLIMSGDAMTDFNVMEAVDFHKKSGAIATIVLYRVETPLEYGVVITDDEGRILRFLEKPGWGEVFSDTVNTGIYILEPEIFKYMENGKNYDWSKDIFPKLLEEGRPLFGCVLDGYWCDIGNLKQYREVHIDALSGKIKTVLPGKKSKGKVWVGDKSSISPKANITGPAIIGSNCLIKENAVINPFSIVGDNCIVEDGARITQAVLWNNNYIGRHATINNSVICRNNAVGEEAEIQDGAIIGDNCKIGGRTTIQQQVKIWPNKTLISGSTISRSIVWGENWPGTLFSALGVKGLCNIEVTPEYAAELGAAFGACLPKGSHVIVSRSPHKAARLIKRALLSGLMSVGVYVNDVRYIPMPITRHLVRNSDAVGGVHVRLCPYQPEMILIEFFDENGININTDKERKVESAFCRQDFRRADIDTVGMIELDDFGFDRYTDHFLKYIDTDVIKKRGFKIVVDYSHGSLSSILPPILGKLNIQEVSLNSHMDANISPRASAIDNKGIQNVGKIVRTIGADLGFLVDGESEKISIVDPKGNIIAGERLLATMIELVAISKKKPVVATQIRAPYIIEKTVAKHKGELIYTQANSRSLMSKALYTGGIDFAGDTKGGFIFPEFQACFDAMVSIFKIMEILAATGANLGEIAADIPPVFIESDEVLCTWESKGKLMRVLMEKFKNKKIDTTDGIRININKNSWVIVRPDPTEPKVHVIAEGHDAKEAKQLVADYKKIVQGIK